MRQSSTPLTLVALLFSVVFLNPSWNSQAATPDYPLKRGPSPRYLVDQNDRAFLIHGDTAWSLIVQATREETEQYLRNRHRKGFNSIIVNLTEHFYCDNPPLNRYGEPPFTIAGDYATPNPAYFAHVDWVLKKAAEYQIQVFLAPSYLGYEGQWTGWYQEMVANGAVKLRQFGRFLGQRYKDFDNIVWLNGGDYNPPDRSLVTAIAEGILEFDTNHIHTVHCWAEFSGLDYYPTESWLTLNSTYTYNDILNKSRADYARTPAYPFFLIESSYEGTGFASNQDIRRQAYWPIFSGSCGQFVGVDLVWGYYSGWQQAMDGVASHDMANLRRLMDSRSWWTFVPDVNNTIVIAGFGDPYSSDPSQYYITAARTPDGASLWAYIPTGRTISVDMSKISGSTVRTWWYSPRTGNATLIGEFGNVGLRDFTTPTNEGASQDWILVADDASRKLPAPGMTTIQEWRTTFFTKAELNNLAISGDTADPDRDGRNNLMEYALYSDPTVPDSALTPVDASIATSGSEKFLNLTYTRRKNAVDLIFAAKASSDLQAWSLSGNTATLDNGFTQSLTVTDSASAGITPRRFLRLQVTFDPEGNLLGAEATGSPTASLPRMDSNHE